jgi:hypothetical protein
MSRKTEQHNDQLQALAIAPRIPQNIADAHAEVARRNLQHATARDTNHKLGATRYNTELSTKTETQEQVAHTLRTGEKGPAGGHSEHWYNFYLSMFFDNKSEYLDKLISNTDLTMKEFCQLAIRDYDMLKDNSRFNLALCHKLGFEQLLRTRSTLSVDQWAVLFQSPSTGLHDHISASSRAMHDFYKSLTPGNQRNFRKAYLQICITSSEDNTLFRRFLSYFDVSNTNEWQIIIQEALAKDVLLDNTGSTYKELVTAFNTLSTANKSIVLSENPNTNKPEFWSRKELDCNDLSIDDFRNAISKTERSSHNHIIARFLNILMSKPQDLLANLGKDELVELHTYNEDFQTIITYASVKIQYEADQARAEHERPAYSMAEDFVVHEEESADAAIKPPTLESILAAAEDLEQRGHYKVAACQYMRAANMNQQDVPIERVLHIAELVTKYKALTLTTSCMQLIQRCIHQESSNRHDLRDPIGNFDQIIQLEQYRRTLCKQVNPPVRWSMLEKTGDIINATVRQTQDTMAFDLSGNSQRIIEILEKVRAFYRPGNSSYIRFTLDIVNIKPEAIANRYAIGELSRLCQDGIASNQVLLSRVYFELQENGPQANLRGCFEYKVNELKTVCCFFTKMAERTELRGQYQNLQDLLSNRRNSPEMIATILSAEIHPLEFNVGDIAMMRTSLGIYMAPPPSAPVASSSMWREARETDRLLPEQPPAYDYK